MSYCPNPRCSDRTNADTATHCHHCHTDLLLQGRYRLMRPLRALDEWESMDVFEVEDSGQTWVLKLLKNKLYREAFEREANALQQFHHGGIPQVAPDGYFSCELDGLTIYCLVMEKIEGTNLEEWLQTHAPIDQPTAIDWLTQLLDILAQLHQKELFHRDIKLPNIMMRPNGRLALVDFGAVRPMTNTYFAKVAGGGLREVTSVVSPGYTPVEQVGGRAVPQSDFYSLGRSLVHLLTGKHPIDLPEDETTGRLVWRDQLKHPFDEWLMELLDNMMAPFPGQRPAHVEVVQKRLAQRLETGAQKKDWLIVMTGAVKKDWLIVINVGVLLLQLWLGWRWWSIRQFRSVNNEALWGESVVLADASGAHVPPLLSIEEV